MTRKSRLSRKSRFELVSYHGADGLWTRVRKVDSLVEAKRILANKPFHSAELWTAEKPHKVIAKLKGK
jgi:hypothetical protein